MLSLACSRCRSPTVPVGANLAACRRCDTVQIVPAPWRAPESALAN